MREIKFRAWDKKRKNWVHGERFRLSINGNIIFDFDIPADKERFIVQQYTGLKDKNSVEIYEGDIVRWFDDRTIAKTHLYKVMFGEYEINSDAYKSHNVGFYADNIDGEYNRFVTIGSVFTSGKYAEVIGNIYENQELLK